MAVDLPHAPSETPPLGLERLQAEPLFHFPGALNFFLVDNRDQVVEVMMPREHRCFPGRAFVALAVAEHGEDPIAEAVPFAGEAHPGRDRKAVAKRSGRSFDAGDAAMRHVAGELSAVLVE